MSHSYLKYEVSVDIQAEDRVIFTTFNLQSCF